MEEVLDILQSITPIELEEMNEIKLLNRVDSKFVFHSDQLKDIILDIKNSYRLLRINHSLIQSYDSLYFDTPDHLMYVNHHNGKLNRYKVRFRHYLTTDEFFLETKFKNNKKKTRKKRMPIEGFSEKLIGEQAEFVKLHTAYDPNILEPKLFTKFNRFTLAGLNHAERVTIDTGISFRNDLKEIEAKNLCIIEVKQDQFSKHSPVSESLRKHKIMSSGMSKYCLGTTYLYPELKTNRFKEKILYVEKLSKNTYHGNIYPKAV